MGEKDKKNTASTKVEVGEIDISAPFQSVKAAVTLFGEGAFPGEKPAIRKAKPQSAERLLPKERQLHLAQKELNKLREQLKNAEATKDQALVELEKSKRIVEDLNQKLQNVTMSKESANKATEAASDRAKQLEEANDGSLVGNDGTQKEDLETAREQCMSTVSQLDAAKQELRLIHQDSDVTLKAKAAAVKLVAEAEQAANTNMDKADELSREFSAAQDSINQVKLATTQAQQEQAKVYAGKDIERFSYKTILEESAEKLLFLREECNHELSKNLDSQLAETVTEIAILQKNMENVKASDLSSMKVVTLVLDDAKESLHRVAEEESSLRSLVESLKQELEIVKKEHSELKEKETEMESVAGNLHVKFQKAKSELEASLAGESRVQGDSKEMISTFDHLSSANENAKREAEGMKKKVEGLKKEVEFTRITLEEADKKLRIAQEEAEEAKAAEARALDQIRILSEQTSAACASTSESDARGMISKEEVEALSLKVEESEKVADMKEASAMAQVEAVKASENEALERLEAAQIEIEDMKAATQEALMRTEMAEAAKKAVEGELKRWLE